VIPPKRRFEAKHMHTYYEDDLVFNEYAVYVPDETISGGFRREHVVTVAKAIKLGRD
jgi:hypothetical protein